MELIIATRKSKLAQVQTEKVMELLKEKENVDSKKLLVMTEGDRRLDVSLNKIRVFGREKFGELSGLAQQYLFYYARENNITV